MPCKKKKKYIPTVFSNLHRSIYRFFFCACVQMLADVCV